MKKRKPKAKVTASVHDKRVAYLDKVAPFTTCYICKRESRNNLMIASNHFRCESCEPMSLNWRWYWSTKPKSKQPEAVRFLLKYCEV